MDTTEIRLIPLTLKTIVAHALTYMLMGVLAYTFLDYATYFARPELANFMRQTDDPVVMAGPLYQPLRGIIFALAFYPLREILFGRKNGWLIMAWLLIALGILGTFGPAPGSLEGLFFTRLPIVDQMKGWLEVVTQAVLLSALLTYWVNHPEKGWLNWVLGILFVVAMLLPVLGLLVG